MCQVCGLPVREFKTQTQGVVVLHDAWLPFGHDGHPAVKK